MKNKPYLDAPTSWSGLPERVYNPIMAMWFSAMFTSQLDNTTLCSYGPNTGKKIAETASAHFYL